MRILKLIIISVILIVFVSNIVYAMDKSNGEIDQFVNVTVQKGDTLWNIAKQYYDGKSDFRELIYNIREMNNLEQGIIWPGQVIKIPVS